MEAREAEIFIKCLAAAGVKEAKVTGFVFYAIWRIVPQSAAGTDKQGRYLDVGPTRIRPLYKREAEVFNSHEEIAEFVKQTFTEL